MSKEQREGTGLVCPAVSKNGERAGGSFPLRGDFGFFSVLLSYFNPTET